MSQFRTKNQIIAAKLQADPDVEESLVLGDAIRVRNPRFSANFETIETDFVQSSLSRSKPGVGGGNVGFAFGDYLRGAGTAGQAPANGRFLRGCALSETLLASAVTGTAQAGGASSITLAVSGSSSTTDAYKGMVIRTTGGTGSGQTRAITAYNGTTKVATVTPAWDTAPDATTVYSIDACALYRPVTDDPERITIWGWQRRNSGNSRRRRLFCGAGNMSLRATPRALADLQFTFSGLMPAKPDDVSDPGSPSYDNAAIEPVMAALAYLGDSAVKFSELTFDLGNEVTMDDCVGAEFGYDPADVTARTAGGRIQPQMSLIAERDPFGDWLAQTERAFWLRWGTAAGKRVSILIPRMQNLGDEEVDVRGFQAHGIPYRAVGDDSEIYLCIH